MELKNTFYGIICSLSFTTVTYSQVGVGTLSPDQSSQLDISATNKGLLIPRVQLTQLSLQAPITGTATASLLVFNTQTINDVTPGFYFWNGSKWVRMINKEDIAPFKETITTLVDDGNGTYTYSNEDGQTTTIDVTKEIKNYQTLTSLAYNAVAQTLTFKDEEDNLNEITLQGLTGPQGEVGPQGLPGTNGVDGLEGPQGPAGLPPTLGAGNLSANDYIAVSDGSGTTFKNTTIDLDLNKVKTDLATGTLSGTGVIAIDTGNNTLLNNATVKINPGFSGQVLTTNAAGNVEWQSPSKNSAISRITSSATINIFADDVVLIDASTAGSGTITLNLPVSGPIPILIGKVFTVKRVDTNSAATVRISSGVDGRIDDTQTLVLLDSKNSYQFIVEAVAPYYRYQILAKY